MKKLPKIGEVVVGEGYDRLIDLYRFCGWGWQIKITDSVWEEYEAPYKWSYLSWNKIDE